MEIEINKYYKYTRKGKVGLELRQSLRGVSGIYQLTNLISGKIYIGSSVDLEYRLYCHYLELQEGTHINTHLQRSFNKHGVENFRFSILCFCDPEDLLTHEQFYMDTLIYCKEYRDSGDKRMKEYGYNTVPLAGRTKGYKHTEEVKKNLGRLSKERWEDPEFRGKMLELYSSVEYKNEQSIRQKIAMEDPDVRYKISQSNKKTKSTPEYKAKIKEITSNPTYREKHRENTTKLWEDEEYRNKIHTPEAIQKRRDITTSKWQDEEYRRQQMETRSNPDLYKRVQEKKKQTQSQPGYVNPWYKVVEEVNVETNEVIQKFDSVKLCNEYLEEKYKGVRMKRGYRKEVNFLIENNRELDGVFYRYVSSS